jgi:hypothetical protein
LFADLPATVDAAFFAVLLALLAGFDLTSLDLADFAADGLRSAEVERAAILIQQVIMRFIHNAAIT